MKRYQIFISSTFTDLKEERSAVVESILKLRHIPVGMESFVAANNEQFNYIKGIIDETDYYVLIIGNRYGTIADDGVGYTEKEFDYAVEKGLPILAFIHSDPDSISFEKSDKTQKARKRLISFKKKVTENRLVSLFSWNTPDKLANEVLVALVNTLNDIPRPGWERGSAYNNLELLEQINKLRIENENLLQQMKKYTDTNNYEGKLNELIYGLSNFNSNPEAINYIGQTLIEASVFLESYDTELETDKNRAISLTDEIIAEATTDERHLQGNFDPIFNLQKINNLLKIMIKFRNKENIK